MIMNKNLRKRAAGRFLILKELLIFLWQNKLWWMIPVIIIFLLLWMLIIFTQSPAVLPFIYTLF